MKKNTINYLLLAGLGIGAFFLFKSKNANAQDNNSSMTEFSPITQPFSDSVIDEFKSQVETNKQNFENIGINPNETLITVEKLQSNNISISEGASLINDFYKAGVKIPSTSKTIKKNVTVKNISTGKKLTGNIAQLSDGSIKHISISQPTRDSQGKTSFDRIIEKNKAKLKK